MRFAAAVLVAASCSREMQSGVESCMGSEEGVRVAANVGPGVWEREGRGARWTELWRVGGTNEGEHLAFPTWIPASREGRLAIPDFQLRETVLVDPDGTWRGPVGGRGSGPGELNSAVAAGWTAAGELQLLDVPGSKLEVFGADGEYRRTQLVERSFLLPVFDAGEIQWAAVGDDGSVYLQGGYRHAREGEDGPVARAPVLRLAPGASAPDTMVDYDVRVVRTDGWAPVPAPGWPRTLAAVGADGLVATGDPQGRYRIRIIRGSEPGLIVCRHVDGLPLRPAELGASVDTSFAEIVQAFRGASRPSAPAAYGRFFFSVEGWLWVQRDRSSLLDGSALLGIPGARWDVFDAEGEYLGEVVAPPAARLQAAVGDRVFAYEIGELDEPWVVAYRMEVR